jgi:hypothetical protein
LARELHQPPYIRSGATFDDYGPAYMYGVDNYARYYGRGFDEIEPELARDWQRAKGKSRSPGRTPSTPRAIRGSA